MFSKDKQTKNTVPAPPSSPLFGPSTAPPKTTLFSRESREDVRLFGSSTAPPKTTLFSRESREDVRQTSLFGSSTGTLFSPDAAELRRRPLRVPPQQTLGFSPITCTDIQPQPTPPQQVLGFSPITCIDIQPAPPPPQQNLGFSPITCIDISPVENTSQQTPPTKKRKGKQPSDNIPYEIKRRLDQKEAEKIAKSPPIGTPATPIATTTSTKPPTPTPNPPTPTPEPTRRRHKTSKPSSPTTNTDATTSKFGVVVHGIALRNDLGKVKKWLESGNKTLGKTVGIRWLRRKAELMEEGKKTSSVVVYLEEETEIDRVRLGGKILRTTQYEPDRRRK